MGLIDRFVRWQARLAAKSPAFRAELAKLTGATDDPPKSRLTTSPLDRAVTSVRLPGTRTSTRQNMVAKSRVDQLHRFAKTPPARRAIRRIKNQVTQLDWSINRVDGRSTAQATNRAKAISTAMAHPWPGQRTYSGLVSALVEDILTVGYGAVERRAGRGSRPFFLIDVDAGRIGKVAQWKSADARTMGRYVELDRYDSLNGKPILDQDLFLLEYDTTSYDTFPTGPVEVAMDLIEAWLGLGDWQRNTTVNAAQEYALNIPDLTDEQMRKFRDYWDTEVVGSGRLPVVSGKGTKSIKLGAATDEGLYLLYQERVTGFIAMAFDLTRMDFNLTADVNKSTAEANADASFDQAVMPLANFLVEQFNVEVVQRFDPEYEMVLADTDPRDDAAETKRLSEIYERGGMKWNEYRVMNGLEADPSVPEDLIMMPANLTPTRLSDLVKQFQNSESIPAANGGPSSQPAEGEPNDASQASDQVQ